MKQNPSLRYRKHPLTSNTSHIQTPRKHSLICLPLSKLLPNLGNTHKHIKPHRHYLSFSSKAVQQSTHTTAFHRPQPKQSFSTTKPYLFSRVVDNNTYSNRYQAVSRQGRRPYNEDRYICRPKIVSPFLFNRKSSSSNFDLYAIFDGHGGSCCSEFLKQNFHIILSRCPQMSTNPKDALRQAFSKAQQKFITLCQSREPVETSGACGVVCLLGQKQLHIANLGDCRAMLLSKDSYSVLTRDHKPSDQDERIRILRHGGKLYRDQEGIFNKIKVFRQVRVLPGNLNVSRTIGDIEVKLKKYGGLPGMISCIPEISTHNIQPYQILLLGSDGLFQAFSPDEIHKIYQEMSSLCMHQFADQLCQRAEQKSSDNITAVAVILE